VVLEQVFLQFALPAVRPKASKFYSSFIPPSSCSQVSIWIQVVENPSQILDQYQIALTKNYYYPISEMTAENMGTTLEHHTSDDVSIQATQDASSNQRTSSDTMTSYTSPSSRSLPPQPDPFSLDELTDFFQDLEGDDIPVEPSETSSQQPSSQ
jgi:hypothetical protein